ncbi:MAG TPA: HPr family phosphocarrier protein [Pyrinomonadaceae bacterium]|nr:HPr family phosphocarrier protein [Pyrinomonadaceae bacterium]
MVEGTVKVVNFLGLHARAAGQLVRLAGNFRSRIILEREDGRAEADGRSMLSLLMLAASKDTVLKISVEGDDETEAFEAVVSLLENGFGEK